MGYLESEAVWLPTATTPGSSGTAATASQAPATPPGPLAGGAAEGQAASGVAVGMPPGSAPTVPGQPAASGAHEEPASDCEGAEGEGWEECDEAAVVVRAVDAAAAVPLLLRLHIVHHPSYQVPVLCVRATAAGESHAVCRVACWREEGRAHMLLCREGPVWGGGEGPLSAALWLP